MIILISEKKITKKKMKNLAEPMDYVLMDATNEKGKGLTEYNYCVPAPGLMIPAKCYKKDDDDDDILCIGSDNSSKHWKKYKKSPEFIETVIAIFHGFADCDGRKNFFIVLKNKDYKHYGKKIKKAMYNTIDMDEDKLECIYLYDDMDKDVLSKELSGKKISKLSEKLNEIGKEFYSKKKKADRKKKKDKKKEKELNFKKKKKKKHKF